MKSARRIIILIAIIAIVLVIGLFIYKLPDIPISIQREVRVLEVDLDDPSHVVERTVTLDGDYYINLFTADYFTGSLTVSGLEQPYKQMRNLQIDTSVGDTLVWFDTTGSFTPGVIYSKSFFNDFVITLFDADEDGRGGSFDPSSGTVIVAEAESYDDAVQIYKDLVPFAD